MENSFEVIGKVEEREMCRESDRNTKKPVGDKEINKVGREVIRVKPTETGFGAFFRGPKRGSPQLDNTLSSAVILIREIIWICLLTVPAIIQTLFNLFVRVRETRLKNKVVVITGAGNGLGKELAMQLSREGCQIACVDIHEESNRETEMAIGYATGKKERVKSYRCDVSKLSDTKKLAEDVLRDFGRVDILINNAGILYGHTVTGGSEAIIRRVIDVNLLSNFWMVRSFLPDMQKNKSGHIVFVNSGSGINPIQHSSAYCASKSGLLGLAYCIDEELRRNPEYDGIKVTSACPYFIATNPEYVKLWKLRMAPISVAAAAADIITGIKRGYFLFHVPSIRIGYFLAALIKLFPHEIYKMYKNVFYVDVTIVEKTG